MKFIEFRWVTGETTPSGGEKISRRAIDPAVIVGIHPRKYGASGTRIMIKGNGGIPVLETYDEVMALLGQEASRLPAEVADAEHGEDDGIIGNVVEGNFTAN